MALTIETDLKEVLDKLDQKIDKLDQKIDKRFEKLEERFDKIDERLNGVDNNITLLKIGQTKIEGDIKALDTKGSVIQPIITGLTVTFAGGILVAIYKYLPV